MLLDKEKGSVVVLLMTVLPKPVMLKTSPEAEAGSPIVTRTTSVSSIPISVATSRVGRAPSVWAWSPPPKGLTPRVPQPEEWSEPLCPKMYPTA